MLLNFEDVTFESGGQRLFDPLSLTVRGAERVALTGRNGAGKSTALRIAIGSEEPSAGVVQRGARNIAFLDQHIQILRHDATILENMRRMHPTIPDNKAYAELARFAFRNVAAMKVVSSLSGGERMRAGLACAVAGESPPDLLVLDEPTNHLDLDSIEVMESALQAFSGAILVVSHDETFLNAIKVDRKISVERDAIAQEF
jgi:ATPase subunit of ABC transporter with duplicated ATPase domains